MFGIIVAGRLVQMDMQQVSENQFLFNVPDADSIKHIVVFMTGTIPFPDGMGGSVYFCCPNPNGAAWMLLGYLANTKPSAIFKIASLQEGHTGSVNPFGQFGSAPSTVAQIGISVEPLEQLAQQTPATNTTVSNLSAFAEFSQKMLENFYNFASSFATLPAQIAPTNDTYVPLSTLQKWFANFQRRLEQNPNFWKS